MLDPQAPATSVWIPAGELPERVRAFGKYPNISDWLPGDILLVASVRPNWIARQIVKVQTRSYGPSHGQWQHAAIYMGNGFLAEATTRGVKYTPLDHYVGAYFLCLRRNPTLAPDERWLVAIEAGVRLQAVYGFSDVFHIFWNSLRKIKTDKLAVIAEANSVICSQLCQEAHAKVTSQLIVPFSPNPAVPAALSQTSRLVDVALHWCSIG